MLRSLQLVDFKSFRDARISFGPFTLLVGTNASGKSNVQDALRFLHGCAQGFTVAEVMDEKWGAGGLLLWRGIRGGAREIIRAGEDFFHLKVEAEPLPGERDEYIIAVGFREEAKALEVGLEALLRDGRVVFDQEGFLKGDRRIVFPASETKARIYSAGRPALARIAEAELLVESLKSIRFLDLAPDAMRNPSTPGEQVLGDRGENLSTVLYNLTEDAAKKEALLGWLRSLTPLDVVDLRFHEDLAGRVLVYLVESSGREISAQSASDGTLRFLALAAALLSSESGHIFFIEEIDNGLHPTRLHLLLDVIEQATRNLGCQVIATTHNPQLLAYLSPEAREDAVLLYRREHEDASNAIRIVDLPDVRRVLESQDLGRLFATGWLEDAVELVDEAEPPRSKVRAKGSR
jgi:predicted ATPase